ncbi:DODA-type extradiol aromatic ring-opening family dioxygenase [Acanthopleuribacter pedis]|uniref:Extradiol ring-cleavage dioxygenase class III enzyme subunit B domain-containing protein n=1 Tax=Acanthopleuribacter pedis TaxID=442870 RepID=A0A8J7QG99_9BACT|nr:hypothetical protein [Acanthopleuribacter pedis]MBO1319796.1 hypothetical protein [Acanthopleuribacter pedis]
MSDHPIVGGYLLPGLPHPLLAADQNAGWGRLRRAFEQVREDIRQSGADLILMYSTMWPSVIGHQIQADPEPVWTHVDELFHDLGAIPYHFKMDSDFAEQFHLACKNRGLATRTVSYKGFPIDTGSVVCLKLTNPDNFLPAVICSSNVYADRAETVVLGKAAVEALKQSGKKAVAVVVGTLSNRLHQTWIDPAEDHIHSLKDQEWNQKILAFLEAGRLEDVAQLSRQIHAEARVHKVVNFKSFWWLSAVMGAHNLYQGTVYGYEPVYGTGSAVIGLKRAAHAAQDLEFDEESPDVYRGDRNVLAPSLEARGEFDSQLQVGPALGEED